MTEQRVAAVTESRLRADARRNRERILSAARDVILDEGIDAPLDAIATRAGVGIATLYRRFPDRHALNRALVLDVLRRMIDGARHALTDEPDPFHALTRYMHGALDLRISAVIPALLDHVPMEDVEIMAVRDESAALMQQLIDHAHADGSLRRDVTFADIGLLLVRLARPLPGPIPRTVDDQLAHRHLDLILDGLRAVPSRTDVPLPGPAMTLNDLRALATDE